MTTTVTAPPSDRTPPQDIPAEQAVLGSMLLSKDAIGDVAEILQSGDFYQPKHSTIYDAILALYAAGEPADPVTVANALMASGQLVKIGGAGYLHELMAEVPLAVHGGHYARIVKGKATFRSLVEAGIQVARLGYGQADDPDAAVDAAQQTVYDLSDHRARGDGFEIFERLLQPTLDGIELAAHGGGPVGVPTGFVDLDKLLGGGLHQGQLIIVAGRPGSGKSVTATNFAVHCAMKAGLAAAMFSLEMSKTEIVLRILSAEARVPLHVLRSGQLSDDDWTKLARRMGEISEAPLFVDDSPNMSLPEIRAKARRLRQVHDLKLIVVDYLSLVTSAKRVENRQQEVADLSRGLKLLAKEVECPVVAVHQLNRGPEGRTDKRPQLSDLRESGAVEQDADVVLFVHREDYYDKESPRAGEADFIVAKQRNGATDTITVAAQLHLARFVDMAI